MAEERRIEQEKEQAKKDAAIRKKKNYNKNAIDTMFPLYGLIGAFLSVLFNQIGTAENNQIKPPTAGSRS